MLSFLLHTELIEVFIFEFQVFELYFEFCVKDSIFAQIDFHWLQIFLMWWI